MYEIKLIIEEASFNKLHEALYRHIKCSNTIYFIPCNISQWLLTNVSRKLLLVISFNAKITSVYNTFFL